MGALLEMEYVPLKFQLLRIEEDVAHKILSGLQGRQNYKVVWFIRSRIVKSRRGGLEVIVNEKVTLAVSVNLRWRSFFLIHNFAANWRRKHLNSETAL